MRRFFSRSSTGDSPQQELPSPEPPPPYPTPVSSNLHIGPARPIRFVYCDENGKFQIDPESIAVLQLVKEPVGVVSVCGRSRQGKSFILNQVCSTKLTILFKFSIFIHSRASNAVQILAIFMYSLLLLLVKLWFLSSYVPTNWSSNFEINYALYKWISWQHNHVECNLIN